MVIKCKVFIKCNLNCIFLVGDYLIWSFTDREKVCWPWANYQCLPAPYSQCHGHCKCRCRMQKLLYPQQNEQNTSDLRTYTYHWYTKDRVLGPTPNLVEHPSNVWHRLIAVFDWDVLFHVSQIQLKPVLHDTSDAILQKLTHQYVLINCVECFRKI